MTRTLIIGMFIGWVLAAFLGGYLLAVHDMTVGVNATMVERE